MNVGVGDTETHTQLFGEPCLGETSLLQMLFDEVAMLFSSVPSDDIYLDIVCKTINL